ncbi:DUF6285 domain-containing protein [Lentisalinibacter orientalis]|jgi:hypothetical protein|uniref:DUF6285 domain-containing protein n=1 Tax=Lentisalinibacter orientalis TaxID=2992241 RepID=UPI00386EC212
MDETPALGELLEAVRGFLAEAREELGGHRGFHALVAANVVDIARRELELAPAAEAAEAGRLRALLGRDGEPAELNRALCDAIREGHIAIDDARLLEHLERTTLDRLAIDQPAYSGARIAAEAGTAGNGEDGPRR